MRKKTTKAQRRRIVEVLALEAGTTPRWVAEQQRRNRRDRRIRQVQLMKLKGGLPTDTARPAKRVRQRTPPIDLDALVLAQQRVRRSRALHPIRAPWNDLAIRRR